MCSIRGWQATTVPDSRETGRSKKSQDRGRALVHLPPSRAHGHLPTYVAIPLATGGFFFFAIFGILVELARTSLVAAAAIAAAWIVLYVLMHYGDGLEQFVCLAAAFLTTIVAGLVAKAYAPDLSMSETTIRLLIVGTVMSALAAINVTLVLRRRKRNTETYPAASC